MLQRLGVRGKILAVVAVPIMVLVLAAGFVTWGATTELAEARNAEDLIETMDDVQSLGEDLQTERRAAMNYVHIIQDSTLTLAEARVQTNSQFDDVIELLESSDDEAASGIADELRAALGGSTAGEILSEPRALNVTPPEGDGWVEFPEQDEVDAMTQAYEDAQAAVSAIGDTVPDGLDVRTPIATLAFRVGFEGTTASTRFNGPVEWRAELEQVYGRVDTALASLTGRAEELAANEDNAVAVASLLRGRELTGNLETVRAGTRATTINVPTVFGFYSGLLDEIVSASSDVAVAMTDSNLIAHIQAVGALDLLIENMRREEAFVERLIRTGSFASGGVEIERVRDLTLRTNIALEGAQDTTAALPNVDDAPGYGASQSDTASDQASFVSVRTNISNGLDASLVAARTNAWPTQVEEEVAAFAPIREQAYNEVRSLASANSQGALLTTILTALAAVAIIVVSLIVALLIARRIVGPLRRLTTTATAVRQELPRLVERVAIPGETVDVTEVQVPVESQDEIGRLAEAFNGVNAATLSIAGEQAALRGSISEMFVNVARRDQVLLNRQLSSIDEMERTEDNQETLTKLFALDHLATRMRRNSESLLVLAGIDTGRRLRRPMPLSDVIRTASSEIELYERVQLELDADPAMLGHSALTAAHLFAELLENATVFSDPGSPVVVRTSIQGDEVVVEVIDSGIGMTAKELEDANNRVGSTAASEILGAQRLGLFVVGRIGRRVGARVHLRSEEGKGTVATVAMPLSLFESESQALPSHVSANAMDAGGQVPAALVTHDESAEIRDVPPAVTRPAHDLPAYTPAAVQEGASLVGRAGGAEEPSIAALIDADAQAAPEATATDPVGLTEGETPSGLPSRRRRGTAGPEDPEREAQSIVGLPARATDAQLSALAAESQGGFTPAVPASEVSPQTAEERASMFRGFRRRSAEEREQDAAAELAGESLGHAVRRGSVAHDGPAIPTLEGDEPAGPREVDPAAAAGAAAFFGARRAARDVPDQTDADDAAEPVIQAGLGDHLESSPTFQMPKLDTDAIAIPALEADPEPEHEAAPATDAAEHAFTVPSLEDDAVAADAQEEYVPDPAAYGGVEQVSLQEAPAAAPYPHWVDDARAAEEPAEHAQQPQQAVQDEWNAPTPAWGSVPADHDEAPAPTPWGAALNAPQQNVFPPATAEPEHTAQEQDSFDPPAPQEVAPPQAVPQQADAEAQDVPQPRLDDLIQSAVDDEQSNRSGFFSKLFGRSSKDDQPSPAPASANASAFAPLTPRSPAEPAHRPMPDQLDQLSAPMSRPAPSLGGFAPEAPSAPVPHPTAPSVPSAPGAFLPPQQDFTPAESAAPESPSWPQPSAPSAAPSAPSQPGVFSPDQLARPAGWEAAGASALQAAQPEAGMTYQPVIQPEAPRDGEDDPTEMTSAVFSELSSLAAERPKVEKTRAGLQRRRAQDAAPVTVTPIAEEVELKPAERDADAVRNRFSAFYSGTQRARTDAASGADRIEPAGAND